VTVVSFCLTVSTFYLVWVLSVYIYWIYIFFNLIFCRAYVYIMRYLASFACGVSILFRYTAEQVAVRVMNITCVDLLPLILIHQSFNQFCMRFKLLWRYFDSALGSSCIVAVSSANVVTETFVSIGKSAVYKKYRSSLGYFSERLLIEFCGSLL